MPLTSTRNPVTDIFCALPKSKRTEMWKSLDPSIKEGPAYWVLQEDPGGYPMVTINYTSQPKEHFTVYPVTNGNNVSGHGCVWSVGGNLRWTFTQGSSVDCMNIIQATADRICNSSDWQSCNIPLADISKYDVVVAKDKDDKLLWSRIELRG